MRLTLNQTQYFHELAQNDDDICLCCNAYLTPGGPGFANGKIQVAVMFRRSTILHTRYLDHLRLGSSSRDKGCPHSTSYVNYCKHTYTDTLVVHFTLHQKHRYSLGGILGVVIIIRISLERDTIVSLFQ